MRGSCTRRTFSAGGGLVRGVNCPTVVSVCGPLRTVGKRQYSAQQGIERIWTHLTSPPVKASDISKQMHIGRPTCVEGFKSWCDVLLSDFRLQPPRRSTGSQSNVFQTWFLFTETSRPSSPHFYSGQKVRNLASIFDTICPRFSIPFALEPPSLRNGAIYMKSFNLIRPSELVSIVIRPRENNDENRERKFVKSSITQPCAVPDCAGIWYADALWATKPMKLW